MLRAMKRAVVTGAGGFIGSHLTELLVRSGCRVRAFVHYNSAGRRGWLDQSECASDIEFFPGDIRDHDAVRRAVKDIDVVYHLAALVGIPYSYVTPQAYVRTNVDGALNVLEAAREHEVERIVLTSTSEVYGTARYCPMDEAHPVRAQSPYAATKTAADQLAASYHNAFCVPAVIARPFNTFGPRQSDRALIPTIIAQLFAGERVQLGSLHPTRDFTYVDDVVRGFVAVASAEDLVGDVVHIGTGSEISVGDVACRIAELMGKSLTVDAHEERQRPEASEVERLVSESSKLRARTNWSPEVDFETGLRRTIAWMESRLHHYRPSEYAI
jgi:NAD dependent epimerase/dehydratase